MTIIMPWDLILIVLLTSIAATLVAHALIEFHADAQIRIANAHHEHWKERDKLSRTNSQGFTPVS